MGIERRRSAAGGRAAELGLTGVDVALELAAAVLLVALGSDYNIFSVGYTWEEAHRRPLREALAAAVPRSTRASNAAGVTLAVSFAFVGLIPIAPFEELAFAVAVSGLIDAFVVRSCWSRRWCRWSAGSAAGRAGGWTEPGVDPTSDGSSRSPPVWCRPGGRSDVH